MGWASRGDGLGFQDREDVFLDRKLAENRSFLREVTDSVLACPQIHGHVRNLFLVDEYPAGVGGDQTYDGVKCGGLASAVRSKQTNDFALPNPNTDTIYNPATTIGFADFVGSQRTHLTCHSGLSDCGRCIVAFHDDPIIVPK